MLKYKKNPVIINKIIDLIKMPINFFKLKYKFNNVESLSCNPFFIIGSGRSGNTLLRAMLCNNKLISIPPESYVLGDMGRKFKRFNYLPWKELVEIIIGELESHSQFYTWGVNFHDAYYKLLNIPTKQKTLDKIIDEIYLTYSKKYFPEAKIWGDKTPQNVFSLDMINKIFPNAKYIHIIRDGRDVVNSYLKIKRYDNVEKACNRWLNSIELVNKFKKKKSNSNFIELKYEKLVKNPEIEIKRVCNFLNISYDEIMLKPYLNKEKLGDVDKLEHHYGLNRQINSDSIGKWKEGLNKKEKEICTKLLNEELKKLGY
ncbi:MAG: sulfotransferase [Candidatus Mcinerneyibacterium aminivorans]|uniref:Sulfotransferase n=1 Tax=Candidatus Mcinerneyibacterium aminivorans TaxID=2703815 RepID=A0A5D0MC61_9BACT|nr:MAG: sulfotransferase [Candidatus Mcinerneyibacterium aminivorans]